MPLLTDEQLDARYELTVVRWEGRLHCAYLNNFRIAGGKPWGGGSTAQEWKGITLREVIRAFPDLQKAVGLNYIGQPVGMELPADVRRLVIAAREAIDNGVMPGDPEYVELDQALEAFSARVPYSNENEAVA